MNTISYIELNSNITDSVVHDYFARLNQSDFNATADLFSEQGCLKPPFEKTIKGKRAIAEYLEKEAFGMELFPTYLKMMQHNQSCTQYQVKGKVKTNYFTVNASWLIDLSPEKEITFIEIKLLETLSSLLAFNHC